MFLIDIFPLMYKNNTTSLRSNRFCHMVVPFVLFDSTIWTEDMVEAMLHFLQTDPSGEKYRSLDWSLEIDAAHGKQCAIDELMKGYLI